MLAQGCAGSRSLGVQMGVRMRVTGLAQGTVSESGWVWEQGGRACGRQEWREKVRLVIGELAGNGEASGAQATRWTER